jgi:hypothetical protein
MNVIPAKEAVAKASLNFYNLVMMDFGRDHDGKAAQKDWCA